MDEFFTGQGKHVLSHRHATLIAFFFLSACCAYANQSGKPLTNEDIIELTASGLSAETIGAKIDSSPCSFDTSVEALKALKRANVSETIILKMISLLNAKNTTFAIKDGKFTDWIDTDDNTTQLKALDIALRLQGAYPTKEQIMRDATSVRVIRIDVPRPRPPEVAVDSSASKPNPLPSNNQSAKK